MIPLSLIALIFVRRGEDLLTLQGQNFFVFDPVAFTLNTLSLHPHCSKHNLFNVYKKDIVNKNLAISGRWKLKNVVSWDGMVERAGKAGHGMWNISYISSSRKKDTTLEHMQHQPSFPNFHFKSNQHFKFMAAICKFQYGKVVWKKGIKNDFYLKNNLNF